MNEFLKRELLGRDQFESFLKLVNECTYLFAEDLFDTVDVYFTVKGKDVVGEIKNRDPKYEHYSTYILELSKYEALTTKAPNGFFISIFGDTMYLFNMNDVSDIAVERKLVPDSTASFHRKIWKQVRLVPKTRATVFVKEEGKWKLLRKPIDLVSC